MKVNEVKITYKKMSLGKVSNSNDVYQYLKNIPELKKKMSYQECFITVYLDNSHNIMCHQIISMGSISGTIVDLRLIFSTALKTLSNNIVVGVDMMDEFIDKAFELGDMEGLSKDDLKNYIRFRANTKLQDLGLKTNWKAVKKESIENMMWFDILSNGVEMQDFFAGRVSSYSKGTIDWSKMYE
jgi:hypothetical protein